jgi:hypothetical protein
MPIEGQRARCCITLFLKLMFSIGAGEDWFIGSNFLHMTPCFLLTETDLKAQEMPKTKPRESAW